MRIGSKFQLFALLVPSLAMALFTSCEDPSLLAPSESSKEVGEPRAVTGPADTNPSWMAEVSARIRDAAHGFVADGGDFVAEVPERRLHARFDDAGVSIGHTADPDGTPIRVRSVGFGRAGFGDAARSLPLAAPELGDCQDGMADPEGNCIPRLEYASPGLIEWWVSKPAGFEQGWDIAERPDGSGRVEIDVQVENADATVSDAGVWLQGDDGSVLIVSQLMALDANGEEVEAWFEVSADGFRVVLDDAGAMYPVEVDPVYRTASWTVEGNAEKNYGFGDNVAGAGDVNGDGYDDVFVGGYAAPWGAAYLFEGSPSGISNRAATTLSEGYEIEFNVHPMASAGDVNGDGFGDVVVGAHYGDSGTGSVYVYLGAADGLSSDYATTLTGGGTDYYFGYSVDGAGDVRAPLLGSARPHRRHGQAQRPTTTLGMPWAARGMSTGMATTTSSSALFMSGPLWEGSLFTTGLQPALRGRQTPRWSAVPPRTT